MAQPRSAPVRPAFALRARALVRGIPPGRVASYGQIAVLVGSARAARQVGYALASLPAGTDVPWHRVIRSSGGIAFEGNVSRAILQRALLESEGVRLGSAAASAPNGWRVNLGAFGWCPEPEEIAELLTGLLTTGAPGDEA